LVVKEHGVYAFRVRTERDVEDWRSEPTEKRQGAWAVHCLTHDQRTFFPTYAKAKDYAGLPGACPVCELFDRRCTYCPSDIEQWLADRNTGFVPSAGHISGNGVCTHHQYGAIPEEIEYEERSDASGRKALVDIVGQDREAKNKVMTVAFEPEERAYCLQCHFGSEPIPPERAATYSQALHFALSVAAALNAALKREANSNPELVSLGYFETWEQAATRRANSK
jgi:hypothetical protein